MSDAHRPTAPPDLLRAPIGRTAETSGGTAGAKNWDRRVRQADELSRSPGFREIRDRILERAAPSTADRALDVGAGTGLLALALAPRCHGVWAIDVAPAMVDARFAVAGTRSSQTTAPR